MRKITKISNIVLIFALVLCCIFLCVDILYAIRVPVGLEETKTRINKAEENGTLEDEIKLFVSKLDKKYTKQLVRLRRKELKEKRDEQLIEIIHTFENILSPLKDGNITVKRVRELLEANESDIYELADVYKKIRIEQAILANDIGAYISSIEGNFPSHDLCYVLDFCIRAALYNIYISSKSVPVRVSRRVAHRYTSIPVKTGDIAIDLAFPNPYLEERMPIKVALYTDYEDEVKKATDETFSLENKKRYIQKRKRFKNKFKEIRKKAISALLIKDASGKIQDIRDYSTLKDSRDIDL